MKHNLILSLVCSSFVVLISVLSIITGKYLFTPATIFLVAALYFGGRYEEQQNDEDS